MEPMADSAATRILLVEDDLKLAALVKEYLEQNDFEVVVEPRGDRANRAIVELAPDLVLLDIMLPGTDGLTVCRDARPAYAGPIIMLTARDEDLDEVVGLEVGQRTATVDGAPIDLTSAEFDLLWLLAQHAGVPLSRDNIYRELRGIEHDGIDRSIDLRISRLRTKLGDKRAELIKSVRGVGYQLVVPA